VCAVNAAELIAQLALYPPGEQVIVRVGDRDLYVVAGVDGDPNTRSDRLAPVPLLILGAPLVRLDTEAAQVAVQCRRCLGEDVVADVDESRWYETHVCDPDDLARAEITAPPDRRKPVGAVPSLQEVYAVVTYDEPRTVSEIQELVTSNWAQRTTVRNRLDELERLGLVIRDGSPARFIRPDIEPAKPVTMPMLQSAECEDRDDEHHHPA
jgi:hypothetical protein